jgi:pimeloyl-ACP methyl ester carboxylesterase
VTEVQLPLNTTDHWVQSADGRLFARSWAQQGAGSAPIVLLHDSLGSVELWREFPEQLAAATGRTVIAYDRLGYGKSDPNPELPGIDFISAEASGDFAAVLRHFEIDRFVAFGHSIGAEMSVGIGAHYGERCAAVIAMSAQSWLEDKTLATIASAQQTFADPEQFKRVTRYHGDKTQWVFRAWTEFWLSPEMRDWNVCGELARLSAPLLVLHGDRDDFTTLDQPRTMAARSGGPARLEILAGVGHLPHREQPERVLTLVAQFLKPLP